MPPTISDISPFVQAERRGCLGLITLDRPKALNALDHSMIRAIGHALETFETSADVAHVAIRSAHDRAFCAGGDLMALYRAREAGPTDSDAVPMAFFRDEYALNWRIHTYRKPYVALVDGIVMGGGAGISIPGRYRVFGDRTRFAMPEVSIGFFPDVGATWYLPRLAENAGHYLALTGQSIGPDDCRWSGLATHRLANEKHDVLLDRLAADPETSAVLDRMCGDREIEQSALQDRLARIGSAFSCDGPAKIRAALSRLSGDPDATSAAEAMDRAAPLSLAIADRQMRIGPTKDFDECLRVEYRIVCRIVAGWDLYEGIRVRLVEKDSQPRWHPARLELVDEHDVMRHFEPIADELELP